MFTEKNKNIKKGKNILILCSTILCFILIMVGIMFTVNAQSGDDYSELNEFLNTCYGQNETIDFPDIYKDGVKLQHICYSPCGSGIVGDEIYLSEAGIWKIVYYYQDKVFQEYEFNVFPQLYSVVGTKSFVGHGNASDFTKYYADGKSGTYLKIYPDEKIIYNGVIDFNEVSKEDTLLSFSVLPEVAGKADALNLFVEFTDVEDPTNSVVIQFKRVNRESETEHYFDTSTYIVAHAKDQTFGGFERSSQGSYFYDGVQYQFHGPTDIFGGPVRFSMTGWPNRPSSPNDELVGTETMTVSMNYENRELFCNGAYINDFDNPLVQTNLWKGFKSGKAHMSFYANSYNKVAFNLLITEIQGDRILKEKYIRTDEKPVITLSPSAEDIPYIICNRNFTLPSATAVDAFGKDLNVSVNVYTAYKTSNQANIAVLNGGFTPKQCRDYYVVYTCSDTYGNKSEYVLKVVAQDSYEKMSFDISGYETVSTVGEQVFVGKPVISNFIGKYSIDVFAELNNTKIQIANYEYGNLIEQASFRPLEVGLWKIKYVYSDVYFSEEYSYNLQINAGGVSFLDTVPNLPRYLIKDATYPIEDVFGWSFSDGSGVYKKADLFITTDGNIAGKDKFSGKEIKIPDCSILHFTYKLDNTVKEYDVPVIDLKYGTEKQDITKYFSGYLNSHYREDNGVEYSIAEGLDDYKLSYIKTLQSYYFDMAFSLAENVSCQKVSFYLTDAIDQNNVLKLSYFKQDKKAYYSVNDGNKIELGFSFDYISTGVHLVFDSVSDKLKFGTTDNTLSSTVTNNLRGNKWKGFSNNKIYLDIVFEDVISNPSFIIFSINGQNFLKYDYFSEIDRPPNFYVSGLTGNKIINEEMVLPVVCVDDIFAVKTTTVLKVYKPDGNFAVSIDGVVLDGREDLQNIYTLKFDLYGQYRIEYSVTDELGGKVFSGITTFLINVEDEIPPIIQIGEYSRVAKFGSPIKIAEYTINDDVSAAESCSVSVYIKTPIGIVFCVDDVSSLENLTFSFIGEYLISYYCSDEAGNASIVSYKVLVEE